MPGLSGGFDGRIVDQLIKVEKIPIEQAKQRKDKTETEKKEVQKIQTLMNELDSTLNKLKTKSDFYRMKVESSHPDILDGIVKSTAMPGTYEFEVRGLAKAEKELAFGFPDRDKTPVGFGYMYIEREDKEGVEITINPGETLNDVANKINQTESGFRAMVINTKYKPDAFRLLVVSEQSGNEAKLYVDEDTTELEFKEQVTGRNLDVLFEDVPVTDETNTMAELVDGVMFTAHRSEPGTRVQVNVVHDIDATMEGIKAFVEKYNEIAQFVHDQFKVDEETKKAGVLAADSSIKMMLRQMQGQLSNTVNSFGKFRTLSDIGITTNPKTGTLNMDEPKVTQALTEDYDSVARLFIRSAESAGVAERMAQELKGFRDPNFGAIKSRLRGLDNIIKGQDQEIERRERMAGSREESIRRRFSALDSKLSGLNAQRDFLAQRFGGGGAAPAGGGGGGGSQGGGQEGG